MLDLLLKAVGTGFILSFMIGPGFFVMLETSIRRGVRAALAFDAGILASDLIYILIASIFVTEVTEMTKGGNEGWLMLIGGVLFLVYGIFSFFRKPKDQKQDDFGNTIHNSKDYIMLFVKGLILNLANPMLIFFWFGIIALGKQSGTNEVYASKFIYITTVLVVFFSIDVLKILGAKKLRPFITNSVLTSLNRITGSILFTFGIVLLAKGIMSKL